MADEENKIQAKSPLLGNQAKPVALDSTTKLDIDTNKELLDNIIEAGLNGGLNVAALDQFTSISNNRNEIYELIDTMARDSSVSTIIRTYAEDVCRPSDAGHIVWCESDDTKISKFVNYLLNVMNVDKNIYGWAYCLIKYGDIYLRLFRESDYKDPLFNTETIKNTYSARNILNEEYKEEVAKELDESVKLNIHSVGDLYSYYVEMIADPGTMYELTKYGKTYGYIETPNISNGFDFTETIAGVNNLSINNYKMKSNDVNIYQADDFVHACLEDNFTRFPETVEIFMNDEDYKNGTNSLGYNIKRGKSMLYDSYKIWREKSLLEDAVLMTRITRSSSFKKVGVEVGDMSKEQVSLTLRRVKEMIEQKSAISKDKNFVEYNNPGPVENFIYYATHNGQGAITVDSVGGDVNIKDLADLDNWVNKFYAAYGIPKAYFGYTDDAAGFNGGSSLAIISSVYATGVERVQNSLIQMLTDAINLFLVNRGCKAYLNNFVLKMKKPLTQEEKDYRESLSNRITAISNLSGLFTDVEDKINRLTILKTLVKTLDYGDELINAIDKEISIIKKQKADEAAKAEEEAAAAEAGGSEEIPAEEPAAEEVPAEDVGGEEDLGLSSVAPMESFTANPGAMPLVEGPDVLLDEDNLPSPADISEDIDFTENK